MSSAPPDDVDRAKERPDLLAGIIDGSPDSLAEISDPVTRGLADSADLYEISQWDERTLIDRVAVRLYELLARRPRATGAVLVAALLATWSVPIVVSTVTSATVAVYLFLSVGIALPLAGGIVFLCRGVRHPIRSYIVTFCLGGFLGGGAAIINSSFEPILSTIPLVGLLVYYFLIVGPIEEVAKLLSVRLVAYRGHYFARVLDGVVYGAIAGLGFATIENAFYITLFLPEFGFDIVGSRLSAAPGHVIWSALAGYYLGLAKFNSRQAGPIMIKGVLLAAVAHGLYNTIVTLFVSNIAVVLIFPYVYHSGVLVVLLVKIRRYTAAARRVQLPSHSSEPPTLELVRTLSQMQALYDIGLLSADEFERKRRELLDRI